MKCRTKNTFSVDLCIKYVEFMSFSYPCNVNFFLIKMTACISMEMVLKLVVSYRPFRIWFTELICMSDFLVHHNYS